MYCFLSHLSSSIMPLIFTVFILRGIKVDGIILSIVKQGMYYYLYSDIPSS